MLISTTQNVTGQIIAKRYMDINNKNELQTHQGIGSAVAQW